MLFRSALAACEGALLLVDATQGIQAQTISNLYLAIDNDLEIIPVINKIDMDGAKIPEVQDQIMDLIGCKEADILLALEMSEVLRVLPMARQGALAFINTYRRLPVAAGVAGIHYPSRLEIETALKEAGISGIFVPENLPLSSNDTGQEDQADSRINIIMLGILCGYTQLLPRPALEHAIALRLPRFAGQNLRTFSAGWHFAEGLKL